MPLEANLFRVSLAGDLTGIRGPEPGLNLRFKPFVRRPADRGPRSRRPGARSEDDFDGGIDVKWGLTRTMTLDLTYNTDFAEAEVDDQQINLTRFSLFFPEKREFFLENAGIFEFGFNPPGRRCSSPSSRGGSGSARSALVVPIDWGARLTGRAGPWSIGLLDVQTEAPTISPLFGEQPEDNWGVVRVKRNLGRRSNVGFIATNREPDGGDSNRVFGFDTDYKPNQNTTLRALLHRRADDTRLPRLGGRLGGRRPRLWQNGIAEPGAFDCLQIGEEYNPEAGFLLRSDIRRYVPRFTYDPRPAKQGRIRNYTSAVTGDIVTDLDDETQTSSCARRTCSASARRARTSSPCSPIRLRKACPRRSGSAPAWSSRPASTSSTTRRSPSRPTTAAAGRGTGACWPATSTTATG